MENEFQKSSTMIILEMAKNQPIKDIVVAALDNSPSREEAAQLLGVSRQTLWDWMNRLGMQDQIRHRSKNGKGA